MSYLTIQHLSKENIVVKTLDKLSMSVSRDPIFLAVAVRHYQGQELLSYLMRNDLNMLTSGRLEMLYFVHH